MLWTVGLVALVTHVSCIAAKRELFPLQRSIQYIQSSLAACYAIHMIRTDNYSIQYEPSNQTLDALQRQEAIGTSCRKRPLSENKISGLFFKCYGRPRIRVVGYHKRC